jgi:Rod binding domain-containing protein
MKIWNPVASAGKVPQPPNQRLLGAAHEFESQMMKELLGPLSDRHDDLGESNEGDALADFAREALGRSLSNAGGFGIADRIVADLSRIQTTSLAIPEYEPEGADPEQKLMFAL